jgi:hypothetical protein
MFMAEDVPRRLKRFYRKKEEINQNQNNAYSYQQNYSGASNNEEGYDYGFGTYQQNYSESEQKRELNKMPSMDYEDLPIDEKNAKDLEKFEKENQDKELALQEIEKFKKENKRMPNKKETEQIAENLYTQIKNNPINYSDIPGAVENNPQRGRGHRSGHRQTSGQIPGVEEPITTPNTIEENFSKEMSIDEEDPKENMKDLFSDEPKKKSAKDEFDLGFEDDFSEKNINDFSDNDEELKEIAEDKESETCPNCKREAEKLIYCPKCGLAYCKSCAKEIIGREVICPKCGTKTKL